MYYNEKNSMGERLQKHHPKRNIRIPRNKAAAICKIRKRHKRNADKILAKAVRVSTSIRRLHTRIARGSTLPQTLKREIRAFTQEIRPYPI